MKKRKLTVCLLAGVLVLAVSAGAAYGSVNGYAAYKDGVKGLLLGCNNVSLAGYASICVDGKEVVKDGGEWTVNGNDSAQHSWSEDPGEPRYESHSVTLNGVNISYNSGMEPQTYRSREVPQADTNDLTDMVSINNDDELERRVTNFLELAADTVVGDLKNNFVSTGKEDGVSRYQVSISQNQVPALINAGLSLMAYSEARSTNDQVIYEDYHRSLAAFYESETGSAVSQELWNNYLDGYNGDWVEANQETVEAFDQVQQKYANARFDFLNGQGGILYVSKDNQQTRYDNKYDFYEAHPEEYADNWEAFIGEDLSLETVDCSFGVDDQGRLVENTIQVNFATVDVRGQSHTLGFTVHYTAKDYGNATMAPLDVTGWRDISQEEETMDPMAADTEA